MRLEALKALVNQLGHDFNNFLVPLLGYSTLVREEVEPESMAMQHMKLLEQAGRRTEFYIENVLCAVRPQRRLAPRPLDLAVVFESELAEWKQALPATVHITVKQDLQPCKMTVDEGHWRGMLRHLLANARFALAIGGELELRLFRETLTEQRAADLGLIERDMFTLVVRDTGFGMDENTLNRAIEPFFTTRPKGQAMGLGLTMVHSVARFHNGQLIIESAEDAGTTATVYWPASTDMIQHATALTGSIRARQRSSETMVRRKVLVVEDDPLVREVVKNYLQRVPAEVYLAADGCEGLRVYQRHARELALIVSDVTMPNMDGIEFYSNIRKVDPHIPFILISGDAEATKEDALRRLEPNRPLLLPKPFTLKAFVETVRAHMR